MVESPADIVLTHAERKFLLFVQRGDVASTRRHLETFKDKPQELDINCTDPLGRSSLAIAIENENLDLMDLLLSFNVKPKDSLLNAISEEYVEGVEMLLTWEEKNHKKGQPYSWECIPKETASFTKDITPLILAAHHNHYEILKLLLDRGATLPMPHDIRCGCDECLISTEEDSLRHSLSRINAYKALASPSLIALSSKDPIRTSFELSGELGRLQGMEHEFKTEYNELRRKVMKFASELLDQTRTRSELSIMLNYDPEGLVWEEGEVNSLERLKMAIKFSQKSFVTHPNVQQLLGAIWYDGLPGFRRKDMMGQCIEVAKLACMFPILSFAYIFFPKSEKGNFVKKPFVKFITHCASYMFFLMLLALASQRIEYLFIEWFGNPWLRSLLEDWKLKERGSLPGIVELAIIMYVFSLIWAEMKSLWGDGLLEYVQDLWNIIDYITNMFFMTWILMRTTSWILVQRDLWAGIWPYYPRETWHPFDPLLISEGCFGAAMILSFLKLVHIFSVNPHLGPLQISLGRMIFDILKFFFLYTLVLFAFGCGMNQLMWYYAELEMKRCYHLPGGLPDRDKESQACFIWRRWTNLFETSQSLFWASFGLVDLDSFDLTGVGSFTRFWALLMFGSYSVINVIVLLNLLIAMMSNSYNIISERSDAEWKFARTKLWLSYFEGGGTVPPPFNVIPSPKSVLKLMGLGQVKLRRSFKVKSKKIAEQRHMNVMRLLVRRYITEQQRKADERGVNEDDINEVKQDISTFRYELIDILKNNGMNTSMVSAEEASVIGKKGRAMERRLMKGFNIGLVEGIINEILTSEKKPTNIFGKLARAIGKKKKEDWNAKVSRASMRRDQIGSSETSIKRSQSSIKRRIQYENEMLLKSLNPEMIAEYNPNLEVHTPTTRIAYARFKVNTLKKEKEKELAKEKKAVTQEKAGAANLKLKAEEMEQKAGKPFVSRSPSPQAPVVTSPDSTPKLVPASKPKPDEVSKTLDKSAPKSATSQESKPSTGQDSKLADKSQDIEPPTTQDMEPPTIQAPKPPTIQDMQPPTTQAPKPPTTQDMQPPTTQAPKPPTIQAPKLPTTQDLQPHTTQASKPPMTQDLKPLLSQGSSSPASQASKLIYPTKPQEGSFPLHPSNIDPSAPPRRAPGKLAVPKAFQQDTQLLPPPRTKPPPKQIVKFESTPVDKPLPRLIIQTPSSSADKIPPKQITKISASPRFQDSNRQGLPARIPSSSTDKIPPKQIIQIPASKGVEDSNRPGLPARIPPSSADLHPKQIVQIPASSTEKPSPKQMVQFADSPDEKPLPKQMVQFADSPDEKPLPKQMVQFADSSEKMPLPKPIVQTPTKKPIASPPSKPRSSPTSVSQDPVVTSPVFKEELEIHRYNLSPTPSETRGRTPEPSPAGKSKVTGQVRTGWL
ncbi:transient receptor potential protein [Procambarus clarkii]|uniref:transient receptor potential protein n=1 Tax=Procambarus clarkii TaxID=6728 RepID=UPI0037432CEE